MKGKWEPYRNTINGVWFYIPRRVLDNKVVYYGNHLSYEDHEAHIIDCQALCDRLNEGVCYDE